MQSAISLDILSTSAGTLDLSSLPDVDAHGVSMQVYEGFGQCLPPGGQVSRDPAAERLLQQRGYNDYFPSDLRLVPRDLRAVPS